MTFAAPWFLLALAAVPAAIWLYWTHVRREQRVARAFVTEPLVPAVAPRRARWRRHVPVLVSGLGLAALIVALARPQTTVAVPVERATIVLATDVSGSMQATDVAPSRIAAAKRAARAFVDAVPARINLGVVAFNQTPSVLQPPTRDAAAVRAALDGMQVSGGTATGEALNTALAQVRPVGANRTAPAAIVLLSDGYSTRGRNVLEVAREARRQRVPVYTIALGTANGTIQVTDSNGATRTERVPPDVNTMREVARLSGGRSVGVTQADQLREVYERLGSKLGTKKEKREQTAMLAGAALFLVLAGGGMSLRWFGNLS